ncbi:Sm-like protein [Vigna angularis]|uniref:U6 snRNA-associated Sm-like protein LSm4 n=1 Tax=Phaseolus angularis TaxID=3914 RepID=A0A8T0KRS7_PHAAN|nr:Sm-like protein [Vigna angularis]
MLPLSLLKTAQGHPMLVELKNGETYNGHLDGDRFWRMPECYIRGNTIKYLRVPDEVSSGGSVLFVFALSVNKVIDKVQEETKSRTDRKPPGVGRGRGRGRDDGPGGRAKGIGRGLEEGGPKGQGGGRGRGGPGGKPGGIRANMFLFSGEVEVNLGTDVENIEGPVAAFKGNGAHSEKLLFALCFLCITCSDE